MSARFYFAIKHEGGGWYSFQSKSGPHSLDNIPDTFPSMEKAVSIANMLTKTANRGQYFAAVIDPRSI